MTNAEIPMTNAEIPMTNAEKIHQLESEYTNLISKPEWQETDAIIKGTRLPDFADNIPAHKSVLQSCYPFMQKNYPTDAHSLPNPATIEANEKLIASYKTELDKYELNMNTDKIKEYKKLIKDKHIDLYGPALTCANLAKMKQDPANRILQVAHDTCINTLEKKNNLEWEKHISAITNDPQSQVKTIDLTDKAIELKSNKLEQLHDCTFRLNK